jgi:hypothetical protein
MHRELRWGLDPQLWALDECGIALDPWQITVMTTSSKRIILNNCRQSGKSECTVLKNLHNFIFKEKYFSVIGSVKFDISKELMKRIKKYYNALDYQPPLVSENIMSMESDTGNRILAISGDEDKNRGLASVNYMTVDEAAQCSNDLLASTVPFVAAVNGTICIQSTPKGMVQQHFFCRIWHEDEGWLKINVKGSDVKRFAPGFLEEQRRTLGHFLYSQEYETAFLNPQDSALAYININSLYRDEIGVWNLD